MSVYAILGGRNSEELGRRIAARFPAEHYKAFPAAWFISAPLTTKEVSAALELPDGVSGAHGVVIPVTNYAGWASAGLWEWLRSRDVVARNG
jgi:hypothetical protein